LEAGATPFSARLVRIDLFRNLFNLRRNRLTCWCKGRAVDRIFSYLR
jgi:hypothetical protein